jgi:hypothetical protein
MVSRHKYYGSPELDASDRYFGGSKRETVRVYHSSKPAEEKSASTSYHDYGGHERRQREYELNLERLKREAREKIEAEFLAEEKTWEEFENKFPYPTGTEMPNGLFFSGVSPVNQRLMYVPKIEGGEIERFESYVNARSKLLDDMNGKIKNTHKNIEDAQEERLQLQQLIKPVLDFNAAAQKIAAPLLMQENGAINPFFLKSRLSNLYALYTSPHYKDGRQVIEALTASLQCSIPEVGQRLKETLEKAATQKNYISSLKHTVKSFDLGKSDRELLRSFNLPSSFIRPANQELSRCSYLAFDKALAGLYAPPKATLALPALKEVMMLAQVLSEPKASLSRILPYGRYLFKEWGKVECYGNPSNVVGIQYGDVFPHKVPKLRTYTSDGSRVNYVGYVFGCPSYFQGR